VTALPGTSMIEITVGPATADVTDEEAAALLARVADTSS
jgi:hypothetical protein